ncbi:hypothetical protein ACWISP_13890 [Thermolongibacillus altinsuensis]
MPIPNVKRMADKFICLMAFSFGRVAEKLVHVEKLNLSYIYIYIDHLDVFLDRRKVVKPQKIKRNPLIYQGCCAFTFTSPA